MPDLAEGAGVGRERHQGAQGGAQGQGLAGTATAAQRGGLEEAGDQSQGGEGGQKGEQQRSAEDTDGDVK